MNESNVSEVALDKSEVPLDQPPPAPRRRLKRSAKACQACASRKIKCDGNIPCKQCLLRRRKCHDKPSRGRRKLRLADQLKNDEERITPLPALNEEITLESLLGELWHTSQHCDDTTYTALQNILTPDSLADSAYGSSKLSSVGDVLGSPKEYRMLPLQRPSLPQGTTNGWRAYNISLPDLLAQHHISHDPPSWGGFFQTFCDEVHAILPILHLPSVQARYSDFVKLSLPASHQDNLGDSTQTAQFAQIILVLALGKHAQTSQSEVKRCNAAGWNLYSAALSILGDLLDSLSLCSDPLLPLQNLVLMAIYCSSIGALDRADKLLGLAVSQFYLSGYHRRHVLEGIPAFQEESIRRLWWCVFVLDRQLGLWLKRPLLIQDAHIDIDLPRNLDEEWMSAHQDDRRTSSQLRVSIEKEEAKKTSTLISYLCGLARCATTAGNVWETLYRACILQRAPSPLLAEYLEDMVSSAEKEIGSKYGYDGDFMSTSSIATKQQILMQISWSSLRLLISQAMSPAALSTHSNVPSPVESHFTSFQLAHNIVETLMKLNPDSILGTFPFLNHLMRAVKLSLQLMVTTNSLHKYYGRPIALAVLWLRRRSAKGWLSSAMTQDLMTIYRLAWQVFFHHADADPKPGPESVTGQACTDEDSMSGDVLRSGSGGGTEDFSLPAQFNSPDMIQPVGLTPRPDEEDVWGMSFLQEWEISTTEVDPNGLRTGN